MRDELAATIAAYLAELADEGITPCERLSVWAVLSDVLTLAGVPADDWPAPLVDASAETVRAVG